jgi:rod shape-determining protein MreD
MPQPAAPAAGSAAARQAALVTVLTAALLAAVVLQLTVVNRLPLPGSAAPDLVLLLVTAIAVCTGPAAGALAGFAGGLALDVAPPAAHYAGQDALVFCLAGYGAAWAVRAVWDTTGEREAVTTFTVMAAAAAAGEAGKAALGLLLSDPDVTTAAISRVLPTAILYDLVLAPFVYWLVSAVTGTIRSWGTAPKEAPLPQFSRARGLGLVFRQASAGAADLRLAGTGANYNRPEAARSLPQLRLSGSRSSSAARTMAAASRGPVPVAGARALKLNFAGSLTAGAAGAAGRRAVTPGKNWLRSAPGRVGGAGRRTVTPGKNWLRSAPSPALGNAAITRAARSPARGWLRSSAPLSGAGGRSGRPDSPGTQRSAAAAFAARSAPSGLSALSGPGTPLARRAPQAGWLRGSGSAARPGPALIPSGGRSGSRSLTPRRGWLGSGGHPRTVIGSGVAGSGAAFRRGSIARRNWYTSSPSRAWLRRSRHPWRKRRQRLLRMVGVGR